MAWMSSRVHSAGIMLAHASPAWPSAGNRAITPEDAVRNSLRVRNIAVAFLRTSLQAMDARKDPGCRPLHNSQQFLRTADSLSRQPHRNAQPRLAVFGADGPAMQRNRSLGNRESQAHTAGAPVPGGIRAVEWPENLRQGRIGNPWAPVAHGDGRRTLIPTAGQADVCAFRSVLHGVSEHILDRAPQQVGVAHNRAWPEESELNLATAIHGFDGATIGDFG